MSRKILLPAALILGVVAALGPAGAVLAHADFVSATPAPGSAVAALPGRVAVTFSEDVARGTDLTVLGPSGAAVSTGATAFTGQQASVAVQPGGPGRYTVQWKSVSADDGDEDTGDFVFTVDPTVPAIVAGASPVAPRTGTGVEPDPAASGGVVALIGALLSVAPAVIRTRSRRAGPSPAGARAIRPAPGSLNVVRQRKGNQQ